LIGEVHEQDIGCHGFSPDLCTFPLARPSFDCILFDHLVGAGE
jgi:hypothetical protein